MCDCEVEIEDLNTTCGFLRPTMNARPCLGTVDLIHRHFFVCTGKISLFVPFCHFIDQNILVNKLRT